MEPVTLSDAKRRVVDHLKHSGPVAAGPIARALGLTVVAVRQHLQSLEALGLVEPRQQAPAGRGRPSIHWSLTQAAATLFPDRHADLTVGLIEAARQAFGPEGLDRLIELRARDQVEEYRQWLPQDLPLAERVQRLADQRTAEGYMAEVAADESDGLVLIEHHCPICEAARRCVGLCAAELQVFRESLGEDVEVERTRHLLSGSDRCAYRIRRRDAVE